jgi:excisionase family DNA binding protein
MRDQGIHSSIEPTVGGDSEGRPDQQLADDRLTWTVPEAARLLGISKDCAYDAARRGDLPVRFIGRRVVVPRTACFGYSMKHTHQIKGTHHPAEAC